jgi:MIP family channel proteins
LSGRGSRSAGARAGAEAIGTFFLVLIGPGAAMVNAGVVGVALAFAFVIFAMVYTFGRLSGAHINPAVTVALWSTGRFPGRDVAPYVVAQCVGAIAAAVVLRGVLGPIGHLVATLPAVVPRMSVGGAFVLEWVMSFALMMVILATGDRVAPWVAAIAIGLTVGLCAMMGGPLTGASMNPARSLGPALVGGEWRAHWLYWVAPVTAMVVAARVYDGRR